jgi:hypothetical protein
VLFQRRFLDGIAAGRVTLAFRRWPRPRVRAGSRVRTAVGVVAIEAVERASARALTAADARRAGYASPAELRSELARFGRGTLWRIRVGFAGADPRVALRRRAALSATELDAVRARLDRLDRASPRGPWTRALLALIARRPGVRAADLAASVGRDTLPFKVDVRKLKELGLTESLDVGYRLSPRGRAALRRLSRSA